jgi:hypothetical protein
MNRLLPFLFLVLSFSTVSWAQSGIRVEAPLVVDQMMNTYVEMNKSQENTEGWRIQLLATTDRQKMETELQRFRTLYPNISVDWVHSKPYYKIRAGAFRSKLDAYRILYLIKQDYAAAYPAMDQKIRPEEFLK